MGEKRPMKISDLLAPNSVKMITGCSSKKRLFRDLADMASDTYGLDATQILDALTERETLGPTAVGEGVALPHARMAQVDRVCGVFARLDSGLDFKAADRRPVDLVFVLLAPLDAGVDHLRALATVSRIMRDADIREKLRANEDPATLFTILTEEAASQAA